jgi:hypothetical protein
MHDSITHVSSAQRAARAALLMAEVADIQLQKELIAALLLAWPFVDIGASSERRRVARVTIAAVLAKAGV